MASNMSEQGFMEWIDDIKSDTPPPIVDYTTHKPTEGELNNITYLCMKYICGWIMRECDFMVVKMLSGEMKTVDDIDEKWAHNLAEYMWDHLMGKPAAPSIDALKYAVGVFKDQIYTMDEFTRNCIQTKPENNNEKNEPGTPA